MSFLDRADALPRLGLGVSTEFGARDWPDALDLNALLYRAPHWSRVLEVGVEVSKGLDGLAQGWAGAGLPTTYHFLDVNLDDEGDLDPQWLDEVRALTGILKPAWMCGDAGLWHFGPRDRAHMLLLPPILCDEAAIRGGDGIARLRDATGLEVIPENPPGHVFLGDLDLLTFFARMCEHGDTGMLLDCAHLAIYQHLRGVPPLTGLADFPLERIVELHVAGGVERKTDDGFAFIEDDHGTHVLDDTWAILEHVASRAPNLRAVIVECERNALVDCLPVFERIAGILEGSALAETLVDGDAR